MSPHLTRPPSFRHGLLAAALGAVVASASAGDLGARFIDEIDGAIDLSNHLLEHRGFLPVPLVITEPAVGAGGGLGLLFFRESIAGSIEQSRARGERMTPPDIGAVAAFKTSNGSQGVGGGYFGTLKGDRFRYLAGLAKVELNLDWYGAGDKARRFTLDAPAFVAQGLMRLGRSDWLVGGRYLYLGASARFAGDTPPPFSSRELASVPSAAGTN